MKDFVWTVLGARPWRCKTCNARFYARLVPSDFAFLVHCPRCGNLDVQKLSRERVAGGLRLAIARILRLGAYRCDPCRFRFYSARVYQRIVPVHVHQRQIAETESPSPAEAAPVDEAPVEK